MRLVTFLLLHEPGFSRVAVEADGEEGDLADDLLLADLLRVYLQFAHLVGVHLDLVQDFVFEHPQMFSIGLDLVEHVDVRLAG